MFLDFYGPRYERIIERGNTLSLLASTMTLIFSPQVQLTLIPKLSSQAQGLARIDIMLGQIHRTLTRIESQGTFGF